AMKLVTDVGTPLVGKIGYFTALEGTWEYIPLVGDPQVVARVRANGPTQGAEAFEEPPAGDAAPTVAEVEEIPDNALVIDVRNPDEVEMFAIPNTVKFPLARIIAGETPEEVSSAQAEARDRKSTRLNSSHVSI